MASIDSSSNGNYKALKKRDIESFMHYDQVYERVQKLCNDPAFAERAAILKQALDDGQNGIL